MTWQPNIPYNNLPLLPPDPEQVETRDVLKACISARAALAELKTAGELLPDQGLLINILPMLEAKDSSRIENIVTTSDRLFQYADREEGADPATKEALRYRTALYDSYRHLETYPLCTGTAAQRCSSAPPCAECRLTFAKRRAPSCATATMTLSIRPQRAKRRSATCWQTGSGSFTAMTISTR